MSRFKQEIEEFEPRDRAAFRDWLAAHHDKKEGVWLIILKKPHFNLSYEDAVQEALCFGWIDSVRNKLDERAFKQMITPRKAKSPWSAVNKAYVKALEAEGLMTDAGRAKIELAKENGAWSVYDAIERLEVPEDLSEALAANAAAEENFEGFAPSSLKAILWWIALAKQAETRNKRIAETVELAAQNLRANHPPDLKKKRPD